MSFELLIRSVGPWPMNCYIVTCPETGATAIVDPGADAETVLDRLVHVKFIVVTHSHIDHIGALVEVKAATGAPVYLHPADGRPEAPYDIPLEDGAVLPLGNLSLRAVHTPGHTPGQTCLDLGDGRVLVGDTLFPGGPGHTRTAEDFATTLRTLREVVFHWGDETRFYPGHGSGGTIGAERPAFEAFLARERAADLHGDVSWA